MSHLKWKILRSTLWTNFGALTTTMFMKKPPSGQHPHAMPRRIKSGKGVCESFTGALAFDGKTLP